MTTILFCGGEDIDVTANGSTAIDTTSTYFRSGYARCSLYVDQADLNTYPSTWWRVLPAFSSNNFWFSVRCYVTTSQGGINSPNTTTAQANFCIRFLDANGITRLRINPSSTTWAYPGGPWNLTKLDASGTMTNLITGMTFLASGMNKVDINVNYSTSGSVTIYQNGTLIGTYSGDVTTNGVTSLGGFDLGSAIFYSDSFGGGKGSGRTYWSEIIVGDSTTDTRSLSLVTLAPTGVGSTAQWTGAYTNVNEITLNDTDGVTTSTANQIEELTLGSLPSGSFSVLDVCPVARATATSYSPQHIELGVTLSGTDYFGTSQALSQSLARYAQHFTTNPATSVNWNQSDLTGMNLSLKSIT